MTVVSAVPDPRGATKDESASATARTLLTDGVDGLVPHDLLEHEAVARAISAVIEGTPSSEPLGIALYGAWGQGKSTIGRLLRHHFEARKGPKSVFVKIDAWKYAYEDTRLPLRRHFLLQAYSNAGFTTKARQLREGIRGERTSASLNPSIVDRAKALPDVLAWSWKRAIVFVVVAVLVGLFLDATTALSFIEGVVLTAFAALVSLLPVVREGLYVTTREDPAWSIEVFDEHLQWLLDSTDPRSADIEDATKVDRFIFFIDDLDRCRDRIVVEAISTLQAFFGRARCVYVVAVDEAQVKRAVRSQAESPVGQSDYGTGMPADEGFLEKIFQVSIHVPRPSLAAIQRYGRDIAAQTRIGTLSDNDRVALLAYLVHPGVSSPREARVIVNDYLLAWAVAEEREAEPKAHLRRGELTDQKLLLAKLVVLKAHFPWFYALLFDSPELLAEWQGQVLRRSEDVPDNATVRLVSAAAVRASAEEKAYRGRRKGTDGQHDSSTTLLDALAAYLSLTRRTLPRDPGQLQQFLYLRSREEFAELFGAAGNAYQLAIATGDEQAVQRAVTRDRGQVSAAIRAAIAVGTEPNSVQHDAARRALLALMRFAPDNVVREHGRGAAAVVYSDEAAAIAELPNEDPGDHNRLVAWMPEAVLTEHVAEAPLGELRDTAPLALAVASRVPAAWGRVVTRALTEGQIDAIETAIDQLDAPVAARLMAPTLAATRPVFQASIRVFQDVTASVTEIDGRWLSLETADESRVSAYLPGDTEMSAYLGTQVEFSGHVDFEGDVVIDRLTRIGGEDSVEVAVLPNAASEEERAAAWRLLVPTLERADARRADVAGVLTDLFTLDWQTEQDAMHCVAVLDALVERTPAAANGLVTAADDSRTLGRWPSVTVAVQRLLLDLPPEQLRIRLESVLRSLSLALPELDDEARSTVSSAVESARRRATDTQPFYDAVSEIALPDDDAAVDALSVHLLAPASASAAARSLRMRIQQRLVELAAAADEGEEISTESLLSSMATLRNVAAYAPREVRAEIRSLPWHMGLPVYSERVLDLREQIGALELAIPASFLRTAATASRRGADLARRHGLRRSSIGRPELRAILAGVTKFIPITSLERNETIELLRRRDEVIPALDQLALIALEHPRVAERLYSDGDLFELLFAEAQRALKSDPERTSLLLRAAGGWRGRAKRLRKQAGREFAVLLRQAGSEEQLEVVVNSMLLFFEEPEQVESVRDLRRELPAAVRRLRELTRGSLVEALERAATQLRIQRANESWFIDLIHNSMH